MRDPAVAPRSLRKWARSSRRAASARSDGDCGTVSGDRPLMMAEALPSVVVGVGAATTAAVAVDVGGAICAVLLAWLESEHQLSDEGLRADAVDGRLDASAPLHSGSGAAIDCRCVGSCEKVMSGDGPSLPAV